MANKKKLQKAAAKFRKENPEKYSLYSIKIGAMAAFIKKFGATEVTVSFTDGVGFINGECYAHANN